MIEPLRKRTLEGKLYKRDDKIEAKLVELASLSRDALIVRCKVLNRDDPNYVPSECLVSFVRASRADNSDTHFEQLYKILTKRVLRRLPNADEEENTLKNTLIREKAFDRFVDLIASDRRNYSEKLDYFEIRFDGAVANLRRDAQKQVWRHENRHTNLDDETGELSIEIERTVDGFDPFNATQLDVDDYQSRLDTAIDMLPPEQRRIVEMIRQDIPIDSKEAGAVTIAKVLNKSEKTIRTYRDQAYATLRTVLTRGEE